VEGVFLSPLIVRTAASFAGGGVTTLSVSLVVLDMGAALDILAATNISLMESDASKEPSMEGLSEFYVRGERVKSREVSRAAGVRLSPKLLRTIVNLSLERWPNCIHRTNRHDAFGISLLNDDL
jgi:hypothetical protein